jgi:tetratricopeptide (TPR) repeat protein
VNNRTKLGATISFRAAIRFRAAISFIAGFGFVAIAAPTVLAVFAPSNLVAQAGATVTGVAKDPGGLPFSSGEVRFSTDRTDPADKRKYDYTFPLGADGTYKATNVAPGSYIVVFFRDGKSIWFHDADLKSGDTKTIDFDLSSEEYLKGLTPDERAKLDEAKKKNAAAIAENAKIADVNKTLIAGRADEKTDPDKAVTELTPLTAARPNEPIIWAALGEAQLAAADKTRAAAVAAKTPLTDPALEQKYADTAVSYQKALDLNAASKKPDPSLAFTSYLNLGQALSRSGKIDEAGTAYENAAKADPTKAGMAFYNEAAVYFNANKLTEANAAADKAIAADPKRADAYYIKASALIPGATLDPATKKFVLPPGCLEAYQEYLELDPTGRHAQDVKELLANLGQPQKNSFKAKK